MNKQYIKNLNNIFENPSTGVKTSILFDLHWKILKLRSR